MKTLPASPPPDQTSANTRLWKIILGVALGLVALCGIGGTCLFVLLLAFGGLGQ
ncbi:MAG TPA: hypothetical protein VI793_22305 [Anaerolineales bacterium]|nr:hypothetical protein [Anaerolineales bacterium]